MELELERSKKVDEAIVLLGLFKIGSVKYKSYNMYTESPIDSMEAGTLSSHDASTAQEKYLITEDDVKSLKKCWESLQPLLQKSLVCLGSGKEDHMVIAYKR